MKPFSARSIPTLGLLFFLGISLVGPAHAARSRGFNQLLDAVVRIDVREIAFEIAILGRSGLDYGDAEKKYRLKSLTGESFSGLQLMCLMFAGFKRFAPDQDVGVDLEEPFLQALQLLNAQRGNS